MGQFFFVDSHQIELLRWDSSIEDFMAEGSIEAVEREKLIDGVIKLRFDDRLGAYPDEQLDLWRSLSNYVTRAVLERVNSAARRISSLSDELPLGMRDVPARPSKRPNVVSRNAAHLEAAMERAAHEEQNPTPTFDDWLATLRPQFATIPTRAAPPNSTPAEVTRHNIDKSYTLTSLLATQYANGKKKQFYYRIMNTYYSSFSKRLSVIVGRVSAGIFGISRRSVVCRLRAVEALRHTVVSVRDGNRFTYRSVS